MSDLPRFGQYAAVPRQEACPRHPGVQAVGYCKRCNRPVCTQCAVPTEVGSICVDCAQPSRARRFTTVSSMPIATYILLGVAVLGFIINYFWPQWNANFMFMPTLGASEPWRFVTAVVTHGSLLHLVFNMVSLYFVGQVGERLAGHWRFASLYLLSAIGGSVAILAWSLVDPSTFCSGTVGASGALYGLLGAVLVVQLRAHVSVRPILILLGINIIYSFTGSGISWQAHLGGLLTGALVAWIYSVLAQPRRGVRQSTQHWWEAAATIGVLIVLAGIAWGLYAAAAIPAGYCPAG